VTVNDFPHIMGAMLAERADVAQINATFAHGQRTLEETNEAAVEAEKRLKRLQAGAAAKAAAEWLDEAVAANATGPLVALIPGDNAALLQEALNGLKARQFAHPAVLALVADGSVYVAALVPAALTASVKAGELVRDLSAIVGGKGGGKPEMARGAGPETGKVGEMLDGAKALLTANTSN